MRNPDKDYIGEAPSEAEQTATHWHRQNHPASRVDCWCCCASCVEINPHYGDAKAAALADIAARLVASVASHPAPKKAAREELDTVHVAQQRTRSGD